MKTIISLFLTLNLLFAISVEEIVKKIEDNLNGESADINISMSVQTKRVKRFVQMRSLSIGNKKSFIKITYPKKDEGITFLKIDNTMWQYVPKIEKIIKIPASMMLQSWMGSDFTNDDLVKESSFFKDYTHKLINEDEKIYTIELISKEEAAVVWGKIILEVSKEYFLPLKASYYDEESILVRELHYKNIKKFKNKFYPTHWEMIPLSEDKKGHKTVISIDDALFDIKINQEYFTKRALKRF